MSEAWPDPSVPYQYPARTAAHKARWSGAVTSALTKGTLQLDGAEPGGDFYELSGRCPRCDHELDPITIEFDVILGATPIHNRVGVFDVQCNCGGKHKGRDKDHRGCGWGGSNEVRLETKQ